MFVLQVRGAKAILGTDSLPVLDTMGGHPRGGKGIRPSEPCTDVVTPPSRTALTPP